MEKYIFLQQKQNNTISLLKIVFRPKKSILKFHPLAV
jgi:hypothetical protein